MSNSALLFCRVCLCGCLSLFVWFVEFVCLVCVFVCLFVCV